MKRLVEFSVRHFQFTVLVFAMLVALGVNAWFSIPRAEDPTFPAPIFSIVAVYPGATPEDLESQVVEPLEERIRELEGLKQTQARIEDGLAILTVEFHTSEDEARKKDEVVREVAAVRATLPDAVRELTVKQNRSADVNIVQVALVSQSAPFHELEAIAERLEDRLETLPGVRGAEVWGVPAREVRVSLDLPRLAELGLSPSQVLAAIAADNAKVPGGSVTAGSRTYNIKPTGDYASIEEVAATVVASSGDQLVRVGDVARVEWAHADPTHITRLDGERAVFITATQQEGTNIERVRDAIWRELDALEAMLPPGIRLARVFDQSVNVRHRLSRLGTDFVIAIVLVLVTLLPLGPRASVVVMVSIPLSLAIGLTLLNVLGFSINQLSIVGFVIALGLLVDDSIVVVENTARLLREGHEPREAAIRATRQIAVAVLGSTAVLVLAFVPLMFLPGLPGRYIRVMPVTVVLTVTASLLVSLTIIPWLSSLLMREERRPAEGPGLASGATGEEPAAGNAVLRALQRGIHRTYAPLLERALAHPRATLAIAALLVLASVALVPAIGFSVFPKAQTPQFTVDIEMPHGSSLAATDSAARFVERALARRPEVRAVITNVGRDNPQIYYNVIPRQENRRVGQLFVLLDRYDMRATPRMLDSLRARLAAWPGARIEVSEFENGPPIDAPIALRLTGTDLDTLRALAGEVEAVLAATPGTRDVHNPVRLRRTDLRLTVDRQKAGLLGVPTVEIDRAVRLALEGVTAGTFREANAKDRDIVVRLPHEGEPSVRALESVHVPAMNGAQVPLRQVAELRYALSEPSIQRHDGERAVTVTSQVRTGENTARVTQAALERLEQLQLPPGYRLTAAGEVESREESFGGIGSAVIVAMFMILAILVLEFGSFRSTLIVISVIPLGVVGGLTALFLAGYTLSFTAAIGFVALIGIEIKTSILLVDFTNQLRAEGVPLDEAIRRAGEVRFLPILLTAATAIGGLLPLALQGSLLYSPLAWVIIGGLVSSTLLARLVTPVLYRLLPPSVEVLRAGAAVDREREGALSSAGLSTGTAPA